MSDLFDCIKKAQLTKLKKVIKKNPQLLESKDKFGNTPLLLSIKLKRNKIANYLLEEGANINATNNIEYTPLMYAATTNNLEIVKKLLHKQADINKKNILNIKAIDIAGICHSYDILELLLKNEKQPATMTKNKYKLLDYSFHGNIKNMKKYLKKVSSLENGYVNNYSPLISATMGGKYNAVKLLLEMGADVNHKTINGDTALRLALHSNYNIAKLLLENGATVNYFNKFGTSPLQAARFFRKNRFYNLFLKYGANPNFLSKKTNNNKLPDILNNRNIILKYFLS